MILYNGSTGGLGRYLAGPITDLGLRSQPVTARLEDRQGLERELDHFDPGDRVTFVHLAGMVSVPACEAEPKRAHEVNVTLAKSTLTAVIEWAARRETNLRVIYVSTGHVYAALPPGSRADETAATTPRSVYANTKLQAEHEFTEIASEMRVPLLIARVFGLVAPQQAPNYVLPGLIRRMGRADLEAIPGLDYVRDYLDARDVCEDLVLLATKAWPSDPTVVNVCSGVPVTLREMLHLVAQAIRPSEAEALMLVARATAGRPHDVSWLVGNPDRFNQVTGEPPQRIPLVTSVRDAVLASNT